MERDKTILYAEDDDNDVFFLRHAFEAAEISNPLQVVQDGVEAVEYLSGLASFSNRSLYPFPCLLLLDLKMPRMTGMGVLEWLRRESPFRNLPAIILSSSAQLSDIDSAYALGVNAFVVKPSCVNQRVRLARAINDFWLHFTEEPLGSLQAAA